MQTLYILIVFKKIFLKNFCSQIKGALIIKKMINGKPCCCKMKLTVQNFNFQPSGKKKKKKIIIIKLRIKVFILLKHLFTLHSTLLINFIGSCNLISSLGRIMQIIHLKIKSLTSHLKPIFVCLHCWSKLINTAT